VLFSGAGPGTIVTLTARKQEPLCSLRLCLPAVPLHTELEVDHRSVLGSIKGLAMPKTVGSGNARGHQNRRG